MSNIQQYRSMILSLMERIKLVESSAEAIWNMKGNLPETILLRLVEQTFKDEDFEEHEEAAQHNLASPLHSGDLMMAVSRHFSNIPYHLRRFIGKRDRSTPNPMLFSHEIPSSESGWSSLEQYWLHRTYEASICVYANWLRGAAAAMQSIRQTDSLVPEVLKDFCGLHHLPIHDGIPAFESGNFSDAAYDEAKRLPFLSHQWQWILVGERAGEALERYNAIEEACRPRAGEPPLDQFGSSETNKIEFKHLNPNQD